MKKMLMWLSPIPFIIIAFGWAFSGNKEVTDHTSYYIGTGSVDTGSVAAGGQNNEYSLIGVDVKITTVGTDENIRYVINESVDGIALEDMSILDGAEAEPSWTSVDQTVDGAIKGQSLLDNGWTHQGSTQAIDANGWYKNDGEDLKEVFDVVPFKFHQEDDMVNTAREVNSYVEKNSINYVHTDYDYATEKALVEKALRDNYGTCALVEGLTDADITAYAEVKSHSTIINPDTNGSATNTGLYYAAAIKTAMEACA